MNKPWANRASMSSRLKLGQYLFMKYGGKVVFFGRFVAVLRAWAAFLAGTNRIRWPRFLLFNALGGIMWAILYGLAGYFLGDNVHRLTGPVGIVAIVLAVVIIIAFFSGFIQFSPKAGDPNTLRSCNSAHRSI
jgi:membrane protein DedA with SNARE-associated domain